MCCLLKQITHTHLYYFLRRFHHNARLRKVNIPGKRPMKRILIHSPHSSLMLILLSDEPLFFLINSYTTGLQPAVLSYMMNTVLKKYHGTISADEIGLPVSSNGLVLPCGASGRFER